MILIQRILSTKVSLTTKKQFLPNIVKLLGLGLLIGIAIARPRKLTV